MVEGRSCIICHVMLTIGSPDDFNLRLQVANHWNLMFCIFFRSWWCLPSGAWSEVVAWLWRKGGRDLIHCTSMDSKDGTLRPRPLQRLASNLRGGLFYFEWRWMEWSESFKDQSCGNRNMETCNFFAAFVLSSWKGFLEWQVGLSPSHCDFCPQRRWDVLLGGQNKGWE